jgi:hypothetical protein
LIGFQVIAGRSIQNHESVPAGRRRVKRRRHSVEDERFLLQGPGAAIYDFYLRAIRSLSMRRGTRADESVLSAAATRSRTLSITP